MHYPTEPILREAFEHLSADATAQEHYLRQLGTWPSLDELALDLGDVASASETWEPRVVMEAVQRVSAKLDEMSGQQNKSLWELAALRGCEWAEVRRLATEALVALRRHSRTQCHARRVGVRWVAGTRAGAADSIIRMSLSAELRALCR